ncbi:unnamed protein product [Prorocentrum cordatum]|uniref:Uncharacterized protein n=1 Tax=Prorocentrum cordatum TaxID=2364126 RepID=A0ABN9R603_9DINO|nr:unnamed protein product [Polarella glacialis]
MQRRLGVDIGVDIGVDQRRPSSADPQGPPGDGTGGPQTLPQNSRLRVRATFRQSDSWGGPNGAPPSLNAKRQQRLARLGLATPRPLSSRAPQVPSPPIKHNCFLPRVTLRAAEERQETWPVVLPHGPVAFANRRGQPISVAGPELRVHPDRLRPRSESDRRPALSLVLVRWGGRFEVDDGRDTNSDGDWGHFGSPPSDRYMSAMVSEGLMRHALLGERRGVESPAPEGGRRPFDFELFSLFVRDSRDTAGIAQFAPHLAQAMVGDKRAAFWMLWPAEWDDFGEKDYAGYVGAPQMLDAMRHCEAAGVRSGFPHPAAQYEFIVSKAWMASLAPRPEARLPAAVLVRKDDVGASPRDAARSALARLEAVRQAAPFPPDGRPAPSGANQGGIKRGVVKLGYSWEGRFVSFFEGEAQLAKRLRELLYADGYRGEQCIVQEWVDFDFEMRLYFLPPAGRSVAGGDVEPLPPSKVEFNAWSKQKDNDGPGAFVKLPREQALRRWGGDCAALDLAEEQAGRTSQWLLARLAELHPEPVAMVRLDFMLLRLGDGRARVVFGEYCEMGACCLAWQEGPPTIWRAAVDWTLR